MTRILKKATNDPRQVRCEECGCLFTYDNEDIKTERLHTLTIMNESYILCPCCGSEVLIDR